MKTKIESIIGDLRALEADYAPSEQERINFLYAYKLNVAFARYLAQVDGRDFNELAPTSQSTWMRAAREFAGIDHDEFLTHIRDGRFADECQEILNDATVQD